MRLFFSSLNIDNSSTSTTDYKLPLVITRSIPNFYSSDPLSTILSVEMSTLTPLASSSSNYLSDLKAYELNDGLTAPSFTQPTTPTASISAAAAASSDNYFTTTTTKVMINTADDLVLYASNKDASSYLPVITSANEIKLTEDDKSKNIRQLNTSDPFFSSLSSSSSSSSTQMTTSDDDETMTSAETITSKQTTRPSLSQMPNRRTLTNSMPEPKQKKLGDMMLEDECDAFSQNKCEPRSLHITCG